MILGIDFDGTIAELEYPELGKIKPNAIDVINRLHDKGHTIIIWTCRSDDHQDLVENYLKKNGLKFHHINDNCPSLILQYGNNCRKISADIYIDDRQLGGIPDDWLEIEKMIDEHIKKYNL